MTRFLKYVLLIMSDYVNARTTRGDKMTRFFDILFSEFLGKCEFFLDKIYIYSLPCGSKYNCL